VQGSPRPFFLPLACSQMPSLWRRGSAWIVLQVVSLSQAASVGEKPVRVRLHSADTEQAGSDGPLEIAFDDGVSAPMWQPVPIAAGGIVQNTWYEHEFLVPGVSRPAHVALKTGTPNGLGIDRIEVDDGEVLDGLPFWLDLDCSVASKRLFPCGTEFTWTVAYPSTTSTTRRATTTATWSATSSSASTTATTMSSSSSSSSTTTSTTTPVPPRPVRSVRERVRRMAIPQAFYSELEAVLHLRANWSAVPETTSIPTLEADIADFAAELVDLRMPPNAVTCTLLHDGDDAAKAVLKFRVSSNNDRNILEIRDALQDEALRRRLNELLARLGTSGDALVSVDTLVTHCAVGALFCCVSVVVYDIVHNAGTLGAYKDMTLLAVALGIIFVSVLSWDLHWLPKAKQARRKKAEESRARVVVSLMFTGSLFQAVVMTLGCAHKYRMLRRACAHPADYPQELVEDCPPLFWWGFFEVFAFGSSSLIVFAIGYCLWRLEWKADCAIEESHADGVWRHVMPLESVMRRSHLLGFLEVRHTDHAGRVDHLLLVVNDVVISYAVVLTSFFTLQQYSLPGIAVAWYPWKLLYELSLGFAVREIFRKVAVRPSLGRRRRHFIVGGIVAFTALDLWLWFLIISAYARMEHSWSMDRLVRIMDIAIGAGLVNYLLTQLHVSLQLRMLSVYLYEPYARHKVKRCLYLADEAEVVKLRSILRESGSRWVVDGTPERFHSSLKSPATSVCAGGGDDPGPGAAEDEESVSDDASSGTGSEDPPDTSCPYVVKLKRTDRKLLQGLVVVVDAIFGVQKDLPVAPRSFRSTREAVSPGGAYRVDVESQSLDEALNGLSTELQDSSERSVIPETSEASATSECSASAASAASQSLWRRSLRRLCPSR